MRNTSRLIGLLILTWLWIPTLDPTDFLIPIIIAKVGWTTYILVSILLTIYLYNTMEGKTLSAKIANVEKEIKRWLN